MKIALIYATKHNHTKKVIDNIKVSFMFDVFNVKNLVESSIIDYDIYLWFCPTYGDAELPLDMEDFINTLTLKHKKFIICELGNYYGYDDYQFGSLKIIQNNLTALGWCEAMGGLSLDSLPKIDWSSYYLWCERLDEYVRKCCT